MLSARPPDRVPRPTRRCAVASCRNWATLPHPGNCLFIATATCVIHHRALALHTERLPICAFLPTHALAPPPLQAFTLTFLAEWGDRSQIATIAMAAAQDPLGITMGAVIGHSMCTGLAVIGGRMLAARISERAIATGGGILFLIFAGHSFIVGPEQ